MLSAATWLDVMCELKERPSALCGDMQKEIHSVVLFVLEIRRGAVFSYLGNATQKGKQIVGLVSGTHNQT